jgi:hypothetical protein
MSNPSWYHTFETITQRWFSKTVVTFRYELEIGILFEVGLKTIIHLFYPPPPKVGFKKFRLSKFGAFARIRVLL